MNLSCVMIVDDSEPDQFICKAIIENENPVTTVLQAYDGQEALELLDSVDQQPEVIFLDINMPRMNGHEFLEAYNKREGNGAAVVIMLTSSEQKEDKEKSMAYKCVKSYIAKPLDATDINEAAKIIA